MAAAATTRRSLSSTRECVVVLASGARREVGEYRRALWRTHSSRPVRPENIDPDSAESVSPMLGAEIALRIVFAAGDAEQPADRARRRRVQRACGRASVVHALPACFCHARCMPVSCAWSRKRDRLPPLVVCLPGSLSPCVWDDLSPATMTRLVKAGFPCPLVLWLASKELSYRFRSRREPASGRRCALLLRHLSLIVTVARARRRF